MPKATAILSESVLSALCIVISFMLIAIFTQATFSHQSSVAYERAMNSVARDVTTAIDRIDEYWSDGMFNRHFHIIEDDIRTTDLKKKFDFVSCISVLEHIREHRDAMQSMFSLLTPGG